MKAAHYAQKQQQYHNWLKRNLEQAYTVRKLFLKSFTKRHSSPQEDDPATIFLVEEIHTLHDATPVVVTSGAAALVNEAALLLPHDEILLPSEISDEPYALWFDEPYSYTTELPDASGNHLHENWLVQLMLVVPRPQMESDFDGRLKPGIAVFLYGIPNYDNISDDERMMARSINDKNGGLLPIDVIGIRTETAWPDSTTTWVHDLKAWMIAMYRLMGDHIEREPVHLNRAERRQLGRAGFPEDGYISELRLRKIVYPDGEVGAGGLSLRFRHRVRGHWRKFYCPSTGKPVGDPAAYRHKFVNDYVRGPKESPLVESRQVISVVR